MKAFTILAAAALVAVWAYGREAEQRDGRRRLERRLAELRAVS